VAQIEISVILALKKLSENVGYQTAIEGALAFCRENEVEGEEHTVRREMETASRDDFVGGEVSI
jgi:hypothetical protein